MLDGVAYLAVAEAGACGEHTVGQGISGWDDDESGRFRGCWLPEGAGTSNRRGGTLSCSKETVERSEQPGKEALRQAGLLVLVLHEAPRLG